MWWPFLPTSVFSDHKPTGGLKSVPPLSFCFLLRGGGRGPVFSFLLGLVVLHVLRRGLFVEGY